MKIKKTISFILVVLLFIFLFWKIFTDFDQIKNIQWKLDTKDTILLLATLLLGPFVNTISWHLYTKALGGNISFLDNSKIWTISNAARFIPGSIWQYAGRVYLLSQKGVSKTFTTTALVLEAFFNIGGASVIVLLALKLFPLNIPIYIQKGLFPLVIFLCIVLILLTGSRVKFIEKTIRELLKNDSLKINKIQKRWLPLIAISVFTQFLLTGLSLYFISLGLGVNSSAGVIPYIGIYAASWLVGYLTFLAPSGLGLREASIAGLMSLYAPLALGSLIAILFRLATLVSEAIMIAVIFVLTRKKSP